MYFVTMTVCMCDVSSDRHGPVLVKFRNNDTSFHSITLIQIFVCTNLMSFLFHVNVLQTQKCFRIFIYHVNVLETQKCGDTLFAVNSLHYNSDKIFS